MNICWESSESYLLLNPCYSKNDQQRFHRILEAAQRWPAHIWLSTSGSSVQKWVGLSKQAILSSAQAINQHLHSTQTDRWVNPLPLFHVGGVGIVARSYLSGAKVFDFRQHVAGKWHAESFHQYVEQVSGTLSALVPAQLHDLVALGKRAPSSLRAVVIGGGVLLPNLYEKAIVLGWPILPSYGLTECASQVATAPLESWKSKQKPSLQLLSHIQAYEHDGRLCFSGSSLLSTYAYLENDQVQFIDPKSEGWFISEDRGNIHKGELTILGRADAIIKVGGENVDFSRLENHLQTLRLKMAIDQEVTLVALPDERLENSIVCASNSSNEEQISQLIECFQCTVLPFERIRKICLVPNLPRSSLGKILRSELIDLLCSR